MKTPYLLLATLLSVTTIPTQVNAGGIPVIDVASITQQVQQVAHLYSQIQTMQSQLLTAKQQLESLSGERVFGVLAGAAYDEVLQAYPTDTLEVVGLEGAAGFDLAEDLANTLDDFNREAAVYLEHSQNILDQSKNRFADLDRLVNNISNASDPKDIMDMTARLNGEEIKLQNEMLKLTAVMAQAEAQQEIQRRKFVERRLTVLRPNPIDW